MGWRRAGPGLLGAALGLIGCRGEEGRVLQVAERLALGADSAATVVVDPGGRFWLGVAGAVLVRDSSGVVARLPATGLDEPRVLGWRGSLAYLRSGDRLAVAAPGADSVAAARSGFGDNPIIVDGRGRAVLEAAASGALLGYDPETLEPLWAWPALALESTALAASPQGDRLYQAVGGEDAAPRVLLRDLQTGRVLGTVEMSDPFHALVADGEGVLFGVRGEGRRREAVSLRASGAGLELLWERRLRASESGVRVAVAGGRVAVWGLGPSVGLRLLDAVDGSVLGRTREDPLDAAFARDGELWALYPGELRRLR